MWDRVRQTDIEQARQQLSVRRDEVLRRQAEELRSLDADQAEIETLNRLVASFSRRFKAASAAPAEAAAPTEPAAPAEPAVPTEPAAPAALAAPYAATKPNEPALADRNSVDKPLPRGRQPEQRDRPRTNFEAFSHAMSKVDRGW